MVQNACGPHANVSLAMMTEGELLCISSIDMVGYSVLSLYTDRLEITVPVGWALITNNSLYTQATKHADEEWVV